MTSLRQPAGHQTALSKSRVHICPRNMTSFDGSLCAKLSPAMIPRRTPVLITITPTGARWTVSLIVGLARSDAQIPQCDTAQRRRTLALRHFQRPRWCPVTFRKTDLFEENSFNQKNPKSIGFLVLQKGFSHMLRILSASALAAPLSVSAVTDVVAQETSLRFGTRGKTGVYVPVT